MPLRPTQKRREPERPHSATGPRARARPGRTDPGSARTSHDSTNADIFRELLRRDWRATARRWRVRRGRAASLAGRNLAYRPRDHARGGLRRQDRGSQDTPPGSPARPAAARGKSGFRKPKGNCCDTSYGRGAERRRGPSSDRSELDCPLVRTCQGRGEVIDNPLRDSAGRRARYTRERTLRRHPAGVEEAPAIPLAGEGEPPARRTRRRPVQSPVDREPHASSSATGGSFRAGAHPMATAALGGE